MRSVVLVSRSSILSGVRLSSTIVQDSVFNLNTM